MARSHVREVRFCFKEVKGNLFSCPETTSLAHCISQDIKMGKGIAVTFKKNFGGVQELHRQGKRVGEVSFLERDGRFIYYLITKPRYFHKPTYDTLHESLRAMKQHCEQHSVKNLAMPRIGCGLDRLNWGKVREMIKETFENTDIEITVYSL